MAQYDAIVIGAGQAGPGVAGKLAGDGKRVAVVEMEQVGGTCLNHGCKPTKALRASAVVAHSARRAAEFGVNTGEVTRRLRRSRSGGCTRSSTVCGGTLHDWLESIEGLDLIRGAATLVERPGGQERTG